jgi:hypothetical protein
MPKQELPTIDPAALAQVSGGATATTTASGNDQVLTALTGILNSIQSIATQQNGGGGGFNQQEMLMLMMIMQQRNQQVVAAADPWGPWGQQPIIRYY